MPTVMEGPRLDDSLFVSVARTNRRGKLGILDIFLVIEKFYPFPTVVPKNQFGISKSLNFNFCHIKPPVVIIRQNQYWNADMAQYVYNGF